MNDREISIELLKLYPSYRHEYSLEQFFNLYQATARFISNKNNALRKICKVNQSELVLFEIATLKEHK